MQIRLLLTIYRIIIKASMPIQNSVFHGEFFLQGGLKYELRECISDTEIKMAFQKRVTSPEFFPSVENKRNAQINEIKIINHFLPWKAF